MILEGPFFSRSRRAVEWSISIILTVAAVGFVVFHG